MRRTRMRMKRVASWRRKKKKKAFRRMRRVSMKRKKKRASPRDLIACYVNDLSSATLVGDVGCR